MNILLIEDNEQNRYLATFLLEKQGHTVTHAADGPSGLVLASRTRYDRIVLDIQLPGMDGLTVALALRADPNQSGIPLIAVTSYAMSGDRERFLSAGFDVYLEKPINPLTFVDEVISCNSNNSPKVRP